MVENHWNGAAAHRRASDRNEPWPPFEPDEAEFDDAEPDGWDDPQGCADASAFLTATGWTEAGGDERPSLTERASGALGALTAVALVVGLGAWTWDLAVRDLSGVPVVRALEGPARVAPDEPGGDVAEHQGLAVNAIQAARDEEPAPERVLLAPSAQGLASDDAAPEAAPEAAASELADAPAPVRVAPPRALGIGPGPNAPAVMLASAETERAEAHAWGGARIDSQPAADPLRAALAEALGEPDPEADTPPGAGVVAAVALVAPGGTVERSPRPSSRPDAPTSEATPIAAATSAEPSAAPTGTWMVQLGSYPAEEVARADWDRLASAQGAYLSDLSAVVSPATSGGREFWRLRAAGLAAGTDARRLCSALSAEGLDCVPVMVR